jgi:phage terminase Nu1 subunit (DNA packaging protein)
LKPDRLYLPKKLMAEAFGISVQAFSAWKVEAARRHGREVLYFLPDVIRWRLNRDQDEDGDDRLNPAQEKARLDKAKADHEELKVDRLRGTLLLADAVEDAWVGMVMAARAKMDAMPSKLAARLAAEKDPMKVEQILREELDIARQELADYDPKLHVEADSPDEAGDEEVRSAAED